MDARNRLADVVKLRCNVCQDFFKLIIKDEWQQDIYNKAKNEVITHGRFKDKYISVYEKMRDIGIENYSVEDMDVTLISELIHGRVGIESVNSATRKAIEQIAEDRNIRGHSSENENDEELYLRGLLELCNLRSFVRVVDKFEVEIDDERRLEYRRTYTLKIQELMDILDEERICLIQSRKDIEKDIYKIIESENQQATWYELWCLYYERFLKVEKNPERYYEFVVRASDAGIVEAHKFAVDYYFLIKKDYEEGEKRLFVFYNSFNELPAYESKSIIDIINRYLLNGNSVTGGMIKIIDGIVKQGYSVIKDEEGLYAWTKKTTYK